MNFLNPSLQLSAEPLRRMLEDRNWFLSDDLAWRGRRLLECLHESDDLAPDDYERMAALNWPELAGEVQDYLDYCRFCADRSVRGSADERRSSWESACLAEANAMLHRQAVRERGYARILPWSEPFRVC